MSAQKTIYANFALNAVDNGKSYNGTIIVDSGTLFQFFDKDQNKCIPDWSDGTGPKFHLGASDSDGSVSAATGQSQYNPTDVKLYWNNTLINFGSDGLSTATGGATDGPMSAGAFKKTVADGVTYFQVVKNLFGAFNQNSDMFYLVGTIANSSGETRPVRSDPRYATCVLTSLGGGTTYHVEITGEDIAKGEDSTTLSALVYSTQSNGTDVSQDTSLGLKFAWYRYDGTDVLGTARQLTVTKNQITGTDCFRCEVTIGGKKYTDWHTVSDLNDPDQAIARITGDGVETMGQEANVYEGQTASVEALAADSNFNVRSNQDDYDRRVYVSKAQTGEAVKNGTLAYFQNKYTVGYSDLRKLGGVRGYAYIIYKKNV